MTGLRSVRLGLLACVALLATPLLGTDGTPTASAGVCLVDIEQRNGWHAVPGVTGPVAMDDAFPCRAIQVRPDKTVAVTDDGGTTWTPVGTAPAVPRALESEGLGGDAALLIGEGDGLWSTADRGRTWVAATGLNGPVRWVSADERDRTTVYVVTSPGSAVPVTPPVVLPVGPGAAAYVSRDAGRTFNPLPGAAGLAASSIASDPATPGRIWLGVDGPAGGLFHSDTSGQAFLRDAGGAVRALATSRLAGGGSEVVAATSQGFLVTRDGGASVSSRATSNDLTDLELEWSHPSALLALSGGSVKRSSDTGMTTRPQSDGLPGACGAHDLARDRSVPSVFLLRCADGSLWRYRSDGTDLSSADNPDGTAPIVTVPGTINTSPARELARVRLARPESREDGSIAFDGKLLYYADTKTAGVIHRQVASTGADAGDLETKVPRGIQMITYDANRHHMFAVDRGEGVWDVDLRNGKAVRLFHSPVYGAPTDGDHEPDAGSPGTFTYDAATDRLLFAADQGNGWLEYDRTGRRRGSCDSLELPLVVSVSGTTTSQSIAGIVATGDGQVYMEAEDDATIFRMDRSCHVLAAFEHAPFSEAANENDALACDTTTFPEAAIWMRDAHAGVFVAYQVPDGYCALPSTVTVTAPPGVATGHRGTVCARLRLRSTGESLAGLPVDLLVAGRGIGSPETDSRGVACADYIPLPGEAGEAEPGATSASARQPVLAAFLGTPAYRPADARSTLLVSRGIPVPPVPPPPPPPVVHPVAPVIAIPVPPPVQPPPPPPNVPQQQPIAQGHPGAQPGAQGAPGGAMAPEEEEETAAQGADVAQFSERSPDVLPWPVYALPPVVGCFFGIAVYRRRRASRVVSQWA